VNLREVREELQAKKTWAFSLPPASWVDMGGYKSLTYRSVLDCILADRIVQ